MALTDQMITPSPDVMVFDLIPGADEFMVIACDGVWNSMTSQEVVQFVYDRLHPVDAVDNNGVSDKPKDQLDDEAKSTDELSMSAKLVNICHDVGSNFYFLVLIVEKKDYL